MLQDRLDAALVAGSANFMRWFGGVHFFFKAIGERAGPQLGQFVILFFCFPCFYFSNFFFKIAYTVQQRRLLRLGTQCAALGGENRALQFNDLALNFGSVIEAYHTFSNFTRRLKS